MEYTRKCTLHIQGVIYTNLHYWSLTIVIQHGDGKIYKNKNSLGPVFYIYNLKILFLYCVLPYLILFHITVLEHSIFKLIFST